MYIDGRVQNFSVVSKFGLNGPKTGTKWKDDFVSSADQLELP